MKNKGRALLWNTPRVAFSGKISKLRLDYFVGKGRTQNMLDLCYVGNWDVNRCFGMNGILDNYILCTCWVYISSREQ